MCYRKIVAGVVTSQPVYPTDVLLQYRSTVSFPASGITEAMMLELGEAAFVVDVAVPSFDPITHYAREIAPKIINGHYEQDYEVVALGSEAVAANQAAAHKTSITNQITALEASITPKHVRKAIRGSGKQWLDDIDDQIAALEAQL